MPSPFPGMDPYIELQEWEDFHTRFNTVLSDLLAPRIEPRYIVRVERRVYVEGHFSDGDQWRSADAAILWSGDDSAFPSSAPTGTAVAIAPLEGIIPMPQERRQTYLVIRERETMEVVTVIETLSPANKRTTSDGREQYLKKREEILSSPANLVEIDLLRGGTRLPVVGMPATDYCALVSRARRRPKVSIYPWTIRQSLRTIQIPLKGDDADVGLDLQSAFNTVYERARYQLSIDYSASLEPPLSEMDAVWATALVSQVKRSGERAV
ncbi:MAG: DUF4058 family protein [Pirellulaceae bacterium]